jgi:hypothetical protein
MDWHSSSIQPPYISIGKKTLTTEEKILKGSVDPALEKLNQSVYQKVEPLFDICTNLYPMTEIFHDYAPLVWLDDVHVTPPGNQIIAQKMLQVISDRNLHCTSRNRQDKSGQ